MFVNQSCPPEQVFVVNQGAVVAAVGDSINFTFIARFVPGWFIEFFWTNGVGLVRLDIVFDKIVKRQECIA